jgi:hypothetical protein
VASQLTDVSGGRHELREAEPDVDGYVAGRLPARTMGRGIEDDRLFFAAPLAAGKILGASAAGAALRREE